MNIGIITFHFAHNYGAVLQCYALQEYLKSNGHHVNIIDYKPIAIAKHYDVIRTYAIKTYNPHVIISNLASAIFAGYKRAYRFNSFINNNLQTTTIRQEYDLIIYGSDQIWNNNINNNDKTYWGYNDFKTIKSITYSASGGIKLPENTEFIKIALKNFSSISVREESLAIELEKYTNKKIQTTLDPVFLLSKKQWYKLSYNIKKRDDKYILIYNLAHDEQLKKIAEEYSKITGLKIIEIVSWVSLRAIIDLNTKPTTGPLDFIGLFRDAEFIFTSSFHGTAFSIIFEKQFMVYMNKNEERVLSILRKLNLRNRFSNQLTDKVIDYRLINKRLKALIEQSKTYISTNVSLN